MKPITKRALSGLMVLIMLVSLFSGMSFTVSAATGTLVSNSGVRHTVSTALGDQALSYYTGNYTYENLSALAGGTASCQDSMSSELFQALSALMTDTMTKSVSYDSLVEYWPETDANNSSSDAVLFYSDVVSSSYNREHVWPKSRGSFKESRAGADLHHLRPTNTNVNSTRGNHTMGNVVGVVSGYSTYQYSGSDVLYYNASYTGNGCQGIVEVNDNIKGDVARILLYVWCRWQEPNLFENISDPVIGSGDDANNGYKVIESLDTLLQWCEMDPVDDWEMGRNDQCENVQGNRNVFIDYPEFAWLVFDQEMPADMPTPSGEASNSAASYAITATSNNTAWGTVSLSGRKITATPAEGYYAAGYTVTSGTATVTQSGNVFTVSASSDCTVRINFAAKTAVTVSYHVPAGVSQGATSGYAGEAITLPSPTGAPTGDYEYTFVGWAASSMASDDTTRPAVYAAGSEYTPTSDTTLYAVYSYLVSDGGGVSGEYTLVTSAPADWSGIYVIASTDSSVVMSNTAGSSYMVQQSITITDNTISTTNEGYLWTLTKVGSYYTIQDSTGAYLKSSSTKSVTLDSSVTSVSESDTAYLWTPSVSGIAHYSTGDLQYNSGAPRFTTYTSAQKAAYLFSGVSGTTWYTTNISSCEHGWVAGTVVAPTCTEAGYTPYTCSLCGATKTDDATAALGHSYGAWASDNSGNHSQICTACGDVISAACSYNEVVTAPTETENGYTTYTCTTCNYSYTGNETPALGSALAVTFSVPTGVAAPATQTAYAGNTITLPTPASLPTGAYTYAFVGWAAAQVDNSETAPTIYTGEYTVTAAATLYAVYTYAVGGTGSSDYVLTDISNIGATDSVVVTMTYTDGTVYALYNANGTSKAPTATIVTVSGDKLAAEPDATLLWNIGGDASGYIFYPEGSTDTWLYCTSTNNGVRVGSNTANTFTIDASSGYLKHTGTGRYVGVYRTNPDWRCYTNTTGNTANQTLGFYVKGLGGTTYYTTVIGDPCSHENLTATAAVEATCTAEGNLAYWHCEDCGLYFSDEACTAVISLSDTVIAATGHSYTSQVTTAATCTTDGVISYTCASCGDSYTETVAATGHSWDEGVTTTAPTATETGIKTYTCTTCGETKTEVLPALGEKVNYMLVSNITSGTEYIMAFNYNGTFYAISYNGGYTLYEVTPVDNVISLEQGEAFLWKIDAVTDGYTISNGTSYISGTSSSTTLSYKTTACTWTANAGQVEGTFWFQVGTRGIGLQSGTTVKNYAVSNATNTGVEYDFDIYLFANTCSHSNTTTERVEPGCTTNGYEKVTCDDCGAELSYVTLLQGHDYVEQSRVDATCTTDGSISYACSRCDSTKTETVAALGHTEVIDDAVAATCTESGLTQGSHCSACGEVTLAQETVPATGHSWSLTETTEVYELYTCASCSETRTAYFRTVSFSAPEGITAIAPATASEGSVITLPKPEGTLTANAYDYSFLGWVAAEVADSSEAGEYYEAGSDYTVTADVTLHALYSYASDSSFGGEGSFRLLTDASLLTEGWQLIIVSSGYATNMALGVDYGSSDTNFDGRAVTVSNNTVTPDSTVQIFTVIANEDGTYSLLSDLTDSENNNYYLAASSNTSNDICIKSFADAISAEAKWSLTIGEDTLAKLTAGTYERNTILFNSTNGGIFTCYGETYLGSESAGSNIYGIRLFASHVVSAYTTQPKQICEHTTVTWSDNGDGTCTGTCASSCGYSLTQAHAATTEVTQAATCTEAGLAVSTCANCGNVTETVIEATGHSYTSEITTQPTCTTEGIITYTCTSCGDSYTESAGYGVHDYVDGTCTSCGAKAYTRVGEALTTWAGEYIIVYELDETTGYAFDGVNDAANNFASGTFLSDGMISLTDADSYMITIEAVEGGYTIKNASGQYFTYATNGNDFTVGTTAAVYTIEFSETDGILIKNAGGAVLRFNASATMFRFYKTTSYGTQKKVWLYEKAGSCHHSWEQTDAIDAVCDDNGLIQYTCSVCGETKEELTDPLGHDYIYNTVAPTCTEEGWTEVTCSRCAYEDIPDYTITAALGHDYSVMPDAADEEHYIAPTCTEAGLACLACSRCGAFDPTATEVPATGHSYANGVCTVCGDALDPMVFSLLTDSSLSGVDQVLLVMEYEGVYYAMSATADGSMLVGTPVTVTNNTITIYADGSYTIFTPVLNLNDGSNTGVGFMTGAEDYLHVNSGTLKVTTSTGNSALAVTQAQVWTGNWDSSDNLIMKDVENAWFLRGISSGMYISNLDSDNYTCSNFGVCSDSFYAVPIYFYGYDESAIVDPIPCNVIYYEGTPATCTEAGTLSYYTCADPSCEHYGKMYADEALTQELTDLTAPATGHDYEATVTAPTCENPGYTTYTCSVCGDSYTGDETAATGHSYAYTNNGDDHTVTCGSCDYSVTEAHNYVDGTCICGAVEEVIPEEPTELEIKISHSVSFDSDLRMNYRVKLENIASVIPTYVAEQAYLVVEKDRYPVSGGLLVETVTLYPDLTTDSTRMLFSLPNIQSVEMGSELRAVLHIFDAEGNEYVTPVDVYSILAYAQLCYDSYSYAAQPELYTLLIDTLNYGAAAQIYFGRRTDTLVNAGMEAYQQYATTGLAEELNDSKVTVTTDREITAVTAMGFSVTFDDKTEMNAKLRIADGYSTGDISCVKVLNAAGDVVDTITEFVLLDDGRLQATYYGVKSVNMRDMYYFVAYVGDQIASDSIGYSVEAYAKSSIAGSNANLADMALKCMYYGDAAYAYFNR